MERNWSDFKQLCNGEQATRDAFSLLCTELLLKHYPDKQVELAKELADGQLAQSLEYSKPRIVFYPKFFLDELTNSRKGQIRKAFNDTILTHDPEKSPISNWLLCIPANLTETEDSWWTGWRTKMEEQHHIQVNLFDGKYLLELLQRYEIIEKWFSIKQNTEHKTEEVQEIAEKEEEPFELLEDSTKSDEIEQNEKQSNQDDTTTTNQSESQESSKDKENYSETTTKLFGLKYLKNQFQQLQLEVDALSESEKTDFIERRKKSQMTDDRFHVEIAHIEKIPCADLIYKARLSRINENHEKALYIYENLINNNCSKPGQKEEIEKGKIKAEQMIIYKNKIYEGDLYFVKRDFIKALDAYEEAYKIEKQSVEIIKKYHETFGEALLQAGNYQQALIMFDNALKAEPNNYEIERKKTFATLMSKGNQPFKKFPFKIVNPIASPYYYLKAGGMEKNNQDVKKKRKKIWVNIFYIAASVVACVMLVAIINWVIGYTVSPKYIGLNSLSQYNYQLQKAEFFYKNMSMQKAHYFDSAMIYYKRAKKYKPYDTTIANRYEKAKQFKISYINTVQENIRKNPQAYFLSMRDASEGLRLFKYYSDPDNKKAGKFGYVDTNMNLIVPPVFDFNYKKMYKAGESFKDGRALVCLAMNQNDTLYFYIDKRGNTVNK